MLGKLIKNEFKATGRTFIPVYIVMFVVAICLKVTIIISDKVSSENRITNILFVLFMITFVLAILAVIFGTVVLILKRFYDNMLKDEGYLSFTLPVTTGQHLASKLIVSYAWVVASAVVICLSVLILFLGQNDIGMFFKEIKAAMDIATKMGYWHIVIEFILLMIIGVYANIALGYTCFSVGQNFNKHRVLGAFITYIAIYMVSQIINSIFMVLLLGTNIGDEYTIVSGFFQPYMIYALVFAVVESVVFTVVTHLMLSKRLNLE